MVQRTASPPATTVRPAATVPLTDLAPGVVAVLREVHDPQSRAVLRALGLTGGARLRLCRIGDPCIIQVRSTRIGLSKAVAQSVFVVVARGDQ